jgi:hypothetical protein
MRAALLGSEGLTHGGAEGVSLLGALDAAGLAIFEMGSKDLKSSSFAVIFVALFVETDFFFDMAVTLVFALMVVLDFGLAEDFVFVAVLFFFGATFVAGVFLAAFFFAAVFLVLVGAACLGRVLDFAFLVAWMGFFAEVAFWVFALVLVFLSAVDLIKLSLPIDFPFVSPFGLPSQK